jgi:hypothetical protein
LLIALPGMLQAGGPVSSDGADVFPLYFPLALVATHAGAPAECRFSSDPSQVIGLVWRQEKRYNALVINLTGKARRVMVSGLSERCGCAVLDEVTWGTVRSANDPLLESFLSDTMVKKGMLALELAPYAIARLAAFQ